MSEAASPAAARAQRCADDVASEEEVATSSPSTPTAAALVFESALGAALGTTARCDGADLDSAGLAPRLEARMRIILRGPRKGGQG